MRDIILLVAILLLVVAGGAFGAMRLGLFGGDATGDADPAAEAAALMSDASAGSPVEPVAEPPALEPPAAPADPVSAGAGPATTAASSAAPPVARMSSAPPAAAVPTPSQQPAAASAPPPVVQNPAVFFRCTGAANVCGALRTSMTDALGRHTLRPVGSQPNADVTVTAEVTVVDESVEQLFGSTFVTRTYSIEFGGEATGGDLVPMPAASTFTFDAAVGQQRLQELSRTSTLAAADRVRAFWRTRTGGN
jgi:hypothetical protein